MNVLGIWDGHDSGAALLQDGRLRFAVNEERLTRRKLEVRFPDPFDSRPASRTRACGPTKSMSLPRPPSIPPRRSAGGGREARNGTTRCVDARRFRVRLSGLTRAVKYRMTEWSPGPVSKALSRIALRRQLAAARTRASGAHTRRSSRGACGGRGVGVRLFLVRGADDRRPRRWPVRDDFGLPRRTAGTGRGVAGAVFARRVLRARDEPAQHARARGRGQGDGAGRLRGADCRRTTIRCSAGYACATASSRPCVPGTRSGGRWRGSTGSTRTSSSPISRSASSSTRVSRSRATPFG